MIANCDNTDRAFAGVLLDWRGTLIVAPTQKQLVGVALHRLHRDASASEVAAALKRLEAVDSGEIESSTIDTDVELHRARCAVNSATSSHSLTRSTCHHKTRLSIWVNRQNPPR